MARLHIKKGDLVKILSGDDKGGVGRVIQVFPKKMRAIVEGMNIVHKHTKPNADASNPKGGIIEKEASIHVSNLMVIDPKTNQPTRTTRVKNDRGFSVRKTLKSGTILE